MIIGTLRRHSPRDGRLCRGGLPTKYRRANDISFAAAILGYTRMLRMRLGVGIDLVTGGGMYNLIIFKDVKITKQSSH